jgi:hypothetical protein
MILRDDFYAHEGKLTICFAKDSNADKAQGHYCDTNRNPKPFEM